jgi:hypothetical protein
VTDRDRRKELKDVINKEIKMGRCKERGERESAYVVARCVWAVWIWQPG